MGKTVNNLHMKFPRASLIKNVQIVGITRYPNKIKKIEISRKSIIGNVARKMHAKFHRASLIRKCFQIKGTKSLTKKQNLLFLERFWYISKSRKNQKLFEF